MASNDLMQSQRKALPVLLKPNDCDGKTFIVTGATSGLGFECTKHLVSLGAARVIMGVRNTDHGKICKASIESETKREGVIDVWYIDYSRYDTIRAFINKVEAVLERIDGVVLNAGVSNGRWEIQEGMESNLTVNLMANMFLTTLLLPVMERKGRYMGYQSRIVHVGSRGPFLTPMPPHTGVDMQDILLDLNKQKKWEDDIDNRQAETTVALKLDNLLTYLQVHPLQVATAYRCPSTGRQNACISNRRDN
jgi:NAD(P)-dependent dehydrogenase (short-subunit alcohol dehydrogenase family)